MESFHWDKHFETGLDDVDRQHHHLVDVINKFGELVIQPRGISISDAESVFKELAAYANYHFEEEEGLMSRIGLDTRYTEHHLKEHKKFLEEVTLMHQGASPEHPEAFKSLLKFLIYWLAYHILGSDQSMARQIKAIRAGQTSGEAYLAEERRMEGATEPLLAALSGLFQQVSERNRELLDLNQTLEAKVAERTRALSEVNRELETANRRLEEIALTDALTGLPNRRHAMSRLAQLWEESVRDGVPLACMMIDADGFKQVNDTYGHDAGDEVLKYLARHLQYSVRTDDVVSRLGGDEFLIICPHTTLGGALHVAQQMHQAVAGLRVAAGKGEWNGSISVGVAARKPDMDKPEDLIKAADKSVYTAKRLGRNCVASDATQAP